MNETDPEEEYLRELRELPEITAKACAAARAVIRKEIAAIEKAAREGTLEERTGRMTKCEKCDNPSTLRVTEVDRDTREVKSFQLCDEHGREFRAEPTFDTVSAGSPMTDPADLAVKFVAEMELAGYSVLIEGGTVSIARADQPQRPFRFSPEALRQCVGQWLARKGISRNDDEIRSVIDALLRKE
jgi:hypothetical protein